MSWWNPGGIFTGGIDMDEEVARGQELDARMNALNEQKVAEGKMTTADYEAYVERNDWASEDYQDQVADAFWEGAETGWDRMTSPITDAASAAGGAVKKAMTWYVLLQVTIVIVALWLAYKFFAGGGSVKQLVK